MEFLMTMKLKNQEVVQRIDLSNCFVYSNLFYFSYFQQIMYLQMKKPCQNEKKGTKNEYTLARLLTCLSKNCCNFKPKLTMTLRLMHEAARLPGCEV